jgi:hypothetical protein
MLYRLIIASRIDTSIFSAQWKGVNQTMPNETQAKSRHMYVFLCPSNFIKHWNIGLIQWTVLRTSAQAGGCRLHPPANASASLANFATLKMEAIRSSETSVNTRPTQRHIPEDDILQINTYFLILNSLFLYIFENGTTILVHPATKSCFCPSFSETPSHATLASHSNWNRLHASRMLITIRRRLLTRTRSVQLQHAINRPERKFYDEPLPLFPSNPSRVRKNDTSYWFICSSVYIFWKNKSGFKRRPSCLCVCVSPTISFLMPEPIFMKLGMYIMALEPSSMAYYINPFHQSASMYVYPPTVAS